MRCTPETVSLVFLGVTVPLERQGIMDQADQLGRVMVLGAQVVQAAIPFVVAKAEMAVGEEMAPEME